MELNYLWKSLVSSSPKNQTIIYLPFHSRTQSKGTKANFDSPQRIQNAFICLFNLLEKGPCPIFNIGLNVSI